MLKRGQLSIFIVIALLVVVAVVVKLFFLNSKPEIVFQCSADSDCVPSSCCHATSCVPADQAPDCSDAVCTLNCEPGTLDCGQASCSCSSGSCVVIQNEIQ